MPDDTTNHNLNRPDKGQKDWGDDLNQNFSDLDTALKNISQDGETFSPERVLSDAINTERGFISGLLTDWIDAYNVGIQPGQCIADDDETVISVDSTLNIDLLSSGASGLQSNDSRTADTWYEFHVIAEDDGSNPAGFAVSASNTLSLPSGYSHHRLVGYGRTDGGKDLYQFHHREPNRIIWNNPGNHGILDTTSPATSWSAVDASPAVPPQAQSANITIFSQGDGSTARHYIQTKHPTANGWQLKASGWAAHSAIDAHANGDTLLSGDNTFRYQTGASGRALVRVRGYRFYR